MSLLLETLVRWKPFTAIVVGDFMLDQSVYGNVDRLCNDAPVPVLHVQRTTEAPGGSANVALDLVAMRGAVRAVGVTGDDTSGRTLRALLDRAGVDTRALITDGARPTTTKRNLIGLAQHRHAQKVFRIDEESTAPIDATITARLLAAVEAALPGADVLLLEDYNKGVCTPALCKGVIERARAAGVPVLVDPAASASFSKYAGCTTITPNRAEAQRGTGQPIPDDAPAEAFAPLAAHLLSTLNMECAVITLDRQGALLLEHNADPRIVPTQARRIYDVTGAGDMVLAALAAARAQRLPWFEAVRFANAAAGLEVEEFGCVPIELERIHADILARERATRGKLRTWAELSVEVAAVRSRPRDGRAPSVVLANGCFDVLHAGHVSLLRRAAALGDFLIVAINDD
ncbi:MAG: PfkB family carbohydrate kinase, partial [Phycisphaerales bacterium]